MLNSTRYNVKCNCLSVLYDFIRGDLCFFFFLSLLCKVPIIEYNAIIAVIAMCLFSFYCIYQYFIAHCVLRQEALWDNCSLHLFHMSSKASHQLNLFCGPSSQTGCLYKVPWRSARKTQSSPPLGLRRARAKAKHTWKRNIRGKNLSVGAGGMVHGAW